MHRKAPNSDEETNDMVGNLNRAKLKTQYLRGPTRSMGATNDSKDMHSATKLFLALTLCIPFFLTALLAETTIAQGEFIEKEKSLSGNLSIEQADGKNYIVLADNFKARKGPDLKIFLSPQSIDSVNGKTAVKGSVLVPNLKEIKGGQRYQIPGELDISKYKSLLIHCEKYTVLWGGGAL